MRTALAWTLAYVLVLAGLVVFIKLAEPKPKPVFDWQDRVTFDA